MIKNGISSAATPNRIPIELKLRKSVHVNPVFLSITRG